ncbi:DNA ligase [Neisseria sp. 83E34]|uniref:DNA ligase n=1 Tax=Neisseria sp. 83E34 TaxID=1692264 RepID=UPI0006CEA620|nr:DNA ligase [Neisseria sp. 83E34]KPN71557.1 DNA ligase [Neisseria sp. 83E34]
MKTILYILLLSVAVGAGAQDLLLAKTFEGQNLSGWAMSEKLDGVRAYWNGKQLISRQGYAFTPPPNFTHNFPPYPLDGELFSARGRFEQISAAVRTHSGNWQSIKFHVFDVPRAEGSLYQRLQVIEERLKVYPANIEVIAQIPVRNNQHALDFMNQIIAAGGEGVIVRDPALPYTGGRSNGFLKLKPEQDAECTVTAHHEGKGKYTGKLGAISCRNELGEFRIGSGFKDNERSNPPPIGTLVTYKHRGYTQKGLPRFATFLRVRSDR